MNGVYQAEELPYYSGPMAYRRGSHWLYRWHQTYWYLSELKWADGDVAPAGEKEFTDPVIYSALVDENSPESPPTSGWFGDKMWATARRRHQLSCSPVRREHAHRGHRAAAQQLSRKHGVSSRVNEVYQAVGGTLALALLAIVGALLAASRCSRSRRSLPPPWSILSPSGAPPHGAAAVHGRRRRARRCYARRGGRVNERREGRMTWGP